jgi:hypothetical protein
MFQDKRSYKLLEELNAAPRIAYQTRIRNAVREEAPAHGHGGHGAAPAVKETSVSATTAVEMTDMQHEGQLV